MFKFESNNSILTWIGFDPLPVYARGQQANPWDFFRILFLRWGKVRQSLLDLLLQMDPVVPL
jgi:hypothetical protein